MFRADKVKISPDASQYLQDIVCTVGLGMLGLAATIFEKAYRAALRGQKTIDANLLRSAAKRVLIPAGNIERETILRIDHTGELNRRLACSRRTSAMCAGHPWMSATRPWSWSTGVRW